jgi:MFS transporter
MGIRDMVYTRVPEHRQGQSWALIGSLFSSMVLVGDLLGTPGILGDARTIVMIGGATATGAAVANLLLYALVHSRVGQAQGEKTGHCPFESS